MAMQKKPEILHVKEVASSRLFKIEQVGLQFSNGEKRLYERMKPSGKEAVMIVALDHNEVLLIEEYAVGLESYELGFPKGLIDPGESPQQAAVRELKEEVGFGARTLIPLGRFTMAPSYFSSFMNIMLAMDLYPETLQGDEPEPLILRRWPIADLLQLLEQPTFQESRNVCALFLLREWLVKQGKIGY